MSQGRKAAVGFLTAYLFLGFTLVVLGRESSPGGSGGAGASGEQQAGPPAQRSIELFAGSASRLPTEEAALLFERQTGIHVSIHFGGSGKMLSEMKLSERGDLYFPGSSDYMELAKDQQLVMPATERIVAYLVPAIAVPKGNPKAIERLADLGRPGMRVAIARPDSVCVGLYAVEVLERAGLSDRVRPNIVTHAESCEKLAEVVSLGLVDAALGWHVFQYWDEERIETVALAPGEASRIDYMPVAVSTFSRVAASAGRFIDFLTSRQARSIFRKWHYLVTLEEARELAGSDTPVGGRRELPTSWRE